MSHSGRSTEGGSSVCDRTEGNAGKRRRNRILSNTRCTTERLLSVLEMMTETQRKWIVKMGFGELFRIDNIRLDHRLIEWLFNRFDPESRSLKIRDSMEKQINGEDVGWILGIPTGSLTVPSKYTKGQLTDIEAMFEGKSGISDQELYGYMNDASSELAFKQRCLLFILGAFLGPTMSPGITKKHMGALVAAERGDDYHWGIYVLECLRDAGRKFKASVEKGKKASGVAGCPFILLLFYLDHIDIGRALHWNKGPRIVAWDSELVEYALKEDTRRGKEFGKARVIDITYGKVHPQKSGKKWEDERVERLNDELPTMERRGKRRMKDQRSRFSSARCSRTVESEVPRQEEIPASDYGVGGFGEQGKGRPTTPPASDVGEDATDVEIAKESSKGFTALTLCSTAGVEHGGLESDYVSSPFYLHPQFEQQYATFGPEHLSNVVSQLGATERARFVGGQMGSSFAFDTERWEMVVSDGRRAVEENENEQKQQVEHDEEEVGAQNEEPLAIHPISSVQSTWQYPPVDLDPLRSLKKPAVASTKNKQEKRAAIVVGSERRFPKLAQNARSPYVNTIALTRHRSSSEDAKLVKFIQKGGRSRRINDAYQKYVVVEDKFITKMQLQDVLAAKGDVDLGFVTVAVWLLMKDSMANRNKKHSYIMNPLFSVHISEAHEASAVVGRASKRKGKAKANEAKVEALQQHIQTWPRQFQDWVGAEIDLSTCDNFFFPILHNQHWSAICIAIRDRKIIVFDSLHTVGSPEQHIVLSMMLPRIARLLQAFDPQFPEEFLLWEIVAPDGFPKQRNIHDCGIFMLLGIELWDGRFASLSYFQARSAAEGRQHVALRVVRHPLNSYLATLEDMANAKA